MIGRQVIAIDDDSDCPVTGLVVGAYADYCAVLWGDANEPAVVPADELMGLR